MRATSHSPSGRSKMADTEQVALCHAKNFGKCPNFIGDNLEIIQITNYVGRAENLSNGPIFQALAHPFSIKL